jgi:hypothetical protein
MNPVLLQVIRQAFYSSTSSIARQTYQLYREYPSLHKNLTVGDYNWKYGIPRNAFIMGAVAVIFFPFLYTLQFDCPLD